MKKTEILSRLAKREPLFTTLPETRKGSKRIMGLESEYAVARYDNGICILDLRNLNAIMLNGGKVYIDSEHVEYCTPEVTNAVAIIAYHEAGKVHCEQKKYSPKLYCNNNDWHGNTYGAHENYFTKAPREKWIQLLPFLVARTLICGAGWYENQNRFHMSQRASFMQCQVSETTTSNRAIINTRFEPLSNLAGYDRMHLICGDANMCEVATFLKIGMTELVISLLEMGALPQIRYNANLSVSDMRSISEGREWVLEGMVSGPRMATELLSLYTKRSREIFGDSNPVTSAILAIMEDTIDKLATNPADLFGRLDWVTKSMVLSLFEEKFPERNKVEEIRSQDMEYHSLDQTRGLYYGLREHGHIERVVDNQLILCCTENPPLDTRAYARGMLAKKLKLLGKDMEVGTEESWKYLGVVNRASNSLIQAEQRSSKSYCGEYIQNPFVTYSELVEHLLKKVR